MLFPTKQLEEEPKEEAFEGGAEKAAITFEEAEEKSWEQIQDY